MLKYVYAIFFLIVLAGMWMIFHFGIKPRSIQVIKPSYFANSIEAGQLLHKVLYPRIAMHNLILWGVRTEDSTRYPILDGFLLASQNSERPFDAVGFLALPSELHSFNSHVEFFEISKGGEELTKTLQQYFNQNKRVLLVLNILDAVHFHRESQQDSEVLMQEKILKIKAVSILNIPLVTKEENIGELQVQNCEKRNGESLHSLGCLQVDRNKFVLKKNIFNKNKFEKHTFTLMMDQEGERDYILYYNERTPTHP